MPEHPAILTAAALDAGYPRRPPVLTGIDLALTPGRVLVIVGPNAAGKTTLLRCLLGTLPPRAGTVTLAGRPITDWPAAERARRLAYIPRRPEIALGFTALEFVAMGSPSASKESAAEALAKMDLTSHAERRFDELSAGQQQRTAWARALVQIGALGSGPLAHTPALLGDEPTSALDPAHALAACALARDLARRGAAVGLVMHDLAAARRLADDALVLDAQGRIAASGPAESTLTPATLAAVFGVEFAEITLPQNSARGTTPPEATLVPLHPAQPPPDTI